MATAPGTATEASAPAASADSTANAGRTALPPLVSGFPAASIQPMWYRTMCRTPG